MSTQLLTDLLALRELLSDPKRWTQEAYARTPEGRKCMPYNAEAVCFCLTGGIGKVAGSDDRVDRLWRAVSENYKIHLIGFNDTHEHSEVLALIDAAIAQQEQNA